MNAKEAYELTIQNNQKSIDNGARSILEILFKNIEAAASSGIFSIRIDFRTLISADSLASPYFPKAKESVIQELVKQGFVITRSEGSCYDSVSWNK